MDKANKPHKFVNPSLASEEDFITSFTRLVLRNPDSEDLLHWAARYKTKDEEIIDIVSKVLAIGITDIELDAKEKWTIRSDKSISRSIKANENLYKMFQYLYKKLQRIHNAGNIEEIQGIGDLEDDMELDKLEGSFGGRGSIIPEEDDINPGDRDTMTRTRRELEDISNESVEYDIYNTMNPEEDAFISAMGMIVENDEVNAALAPYGLETKTSGENKTKIDDLPNLVSNKKELYDILKTNPNYKNASDEELDFVINSIYTQDERTQEYTRKDEEEIDKEFFDAYNAGKRTADFLHKSKTIKDYGDAAVGVAEKGFKSFVGATDKGKGGKIGGIPKSAGMANTNEDFFNMRDIVLEAINADDTDDVNLNAIDNEDATNTDSMLQLLKEEKSNVSGTEAKMSKPKNVSGNVSKSEIKLDKAKKDSKNVSGKEAKIEKPKKTTGSISKGEATIDKPKKPTGSVSSQEDDVYHAAKDVMDYQSSNVEEDITEDDAWVDSLSDGADKEEKEETDKKDEIPTFRNKKDNSPLISRFTDVPNLFKQFVKDEYADDISMRSVAISAVDTQTNSFAVIFDTFEGEAFGKKVANAFLKYVNAEVEEMEIVKFNSDDKNITILQVFFYGLELKECGTEYDDIHNPYKRINAYKSKQRQVAPSGKYYKAKDENRKRTFVESIADRVNSIFGV